MAGDDPGTRRADDTGPAPAGSPPGGQELRDWRVRRGVSLSAVARHGGRVVTGATDGRVTVWDAARRRAVHGFRAHAGDVWSVQYGRGGSLLVTSGEDGRIRLWSSDGRRPVSSPSSRRR